MDGIFIFHKNVRILGRFYAIFQYMYCLYIPGGSRVLDTDGQTCCQVFLLVVRVFSPHSISARAPKVANIPAHKTFPLSASLSLPQT